VTQRRFVIFSAMMALCSAAPVVAGVLPQAGAVISLSVAACAAAFAVAAGLGLDRFFMNAGAQSPTATIAEIVRCAEHAAKEGVAALESVGAARNCPGLRRGLQLVLAGQEPDSIKRTLDRELDQALERRARGSSREMWLAAAPIIGAVTIGAIAVSVVASGGTPAGLGFGAAAGVFGGLLACLIAMSIRPASPAELAQREAADVLARTIVIRGVCLIASGTSPRGVEQELRMLLPQRPESAQVRRAA
jgi:chemotaxis protein MotA